MLELTPEEQALIQQHRAVNEEAARIREKELQDEIQEQVEKQKKKDIRFSKKVVLFVFLTIIFYTVTSMFMFYRLGLEASTLTTCVFAFFGTEAISLAGITISKIKKGEDE